MNTCLFLLRPPLFTNFDRGRFLAAANLEMDLICNGARRFLIEASTDLETWTPWFSTPESDHGEVHFTMPGGFDTSPQRFFRASQLANRD